MMILKNIHIFIIVSTLFIVSCNTTRLTEKDMTLDLAVRISRGSVGFGSSGIIDFSERKYFYQDVLKSIQEKYFYNNLVDDYELSELYYHCLNLYFSDTLLCNIERMDVVCAWKTIEIVVNNNKITYSGFYKESHPKHYHIDNIYKIVGKYINKNKNPHPDSITNVTKFYKWDKEKYPYLKL